MDYSKMTDAQLEALAAGKPPAAPAQSGAKLDYASMSDAELEAIAAGAAPKITAMQAARIGAEDGATFGTRGFLAGVGGGIGRGLGALTGGAGISGAIDSAKKGFTEEREAAKQEKANALADQPGAMIGGNIAGGLVTLPFAAGKGLAAAIKMGAAQGAVTGAGSALSEAESLEEAAAMTAGGAALGGAFGAAGKGLAAGAKGVKNTAARLAYRTLGPNARDASKSLAKGEVEKIGTQLLKDKIIGWVPKSYKKIGDAVEARAKVVGEALGKTKDEIEALAQREGLIPPGTKLPGVNPLKVAMKAYESVRVNPKLPGADKTNARFAAWTREFFAKNQDLSSFKDAEALKTALNDTIKWDRLPGTDIPIAEEFARALSKALRSESEEVAEELAGFGGKALVGKFKGQKQAYGALKTAEEIVAKKEARTLANQLATPAYSGLGATVGLLSSDDPETRIENAFIGAGVGAGSKFLRTGGVQLAAKGMNSLSNLLKLAPKAAAPAAQAGILNLIRPKQEQ